MAKVYFNNVSFQQGNCTFNFYNASVEVPDDAIPGTDCPEISRTLSWQGPFEAIELETNMDLEYHEGDEDRIMVSGPENWVNNLDFLVEHDSLMVRHKDTINSGCFASRPKLIVYHRGLKEVKASNSGNVTFYGRTCLESLCLTSCDTVRFMDGIETSALSIQSKGSAEVIIPHGTIRRLHIHITGSGNVTAMGLYCLSTEINVVGSGLVSLQGETDKLTAVVTGSGEIRCGEFKAAIGSVGATGGIVECRVDHLSRLTRNNGTIINH